MATGDMRRMYRSRLVMASALCAATALFVLPATAQDAWMMGDWCAPNREILAIDRSGPGFNEIAICTWTSKSQSGPKVNVRIACDVYEEGLVVDKKTMRFQASQTGPSAMSVRVDGGPATAYRKC